MRALWAVGLVLVLAGTGGLAGEPEPEWVLRYQEMVAARDAGDFEGWLAGATATLALRPGHPILVFHQARALARLGRSADSIAALERVVALGAWIDPSDHPDFVEVVKSPGWAGLVERVAKAREHAGPGGVALEVATDAIVPEGIARDSRNGDLYLGSMLRRSILRLRADGTTEAFVAPGQDGVLDPLGLDIDAGRGELWAVSVVAPELGEREGVGTTAVHGWRLADGALVAKVILLPNPEEPHQFNDLALAPDGAVYLTDPIAGSLWRLRRSDLTKVEPFGEPGGAPGANGVVVDSVRGVVWVGCYNFGLCRADLESQQIEVLEPPAGYTLLGIDGLELHRGRLVAIQNAYGLDRVVEIELDDAGTAIRGIRVVDARHPAQHDPTTGVVVPGEGDSPDRFLWIANARIDPWYRSQGVQVPTGSTVILGTPLP